MDGFLETITRKLISYGLPATEIFSGNNAPLPGYFRPTKEWDIVVVRNNRLLAAIELKSQIGSLGNNFNNRTEEALGNSVDIWTAYREGAFNLSPAPFVGFLFLLEHSAKSTSSVSVKQNHFAVFPEFRGASYADRYRLLCRKLMLERHYTSTCLLLSDRLNYEAQDNYLDADENLSGSQFLSMLRSHITAFTQK